MSDDYCNPQTASEALNSYVEQLLADRHADLPAGLSRDELVSYVLAAEMKSFQPGADLPREAFLDHLQAAVEQEWQQQRHLRPDRSSRRVSRGSFLRTVGGLAAGVLVGVAVDHQITTPHAALPPLVGTNGRWYHLASTQDVSVGSIRRFTAGGIDGYLFNEGGQYRAVSAICTHMGCHIDWKEEDYRFHCLCHDARFEASGVVAAGAPTVPLPSIAVREEAGSIYVMGTQQSTWGETSSNG